MPLVALAVVSGVITLQVQKESLATAVNLPFWSRLGNALVAYVAYLGKMFWPLHLAVFYPHPLVVGNELPWWQIIGAGLALATVSYLVVRWGRRRPYLPVGWLWYLWTLVPVIGLVQVGEQGMADRYTYITLVGIFIILAFGAADLAHGRRWRQIALGAGFGLALLACLMLTWAQVGYWRDSETVFAHPRQ